MKRQRHLDHHKSYNTNLLYQVVLPSSYFLEPYQSRLIEVFPYLYYTSLNIAPEEERLGSKSTASTHNSESTDTRHFTAENFYKALLQDIQHAQSSIIIASAFAASKRVNNLLRYLIAKRGRWYQSKSVL